MDAGTKDRRRSAEDVAAEAKRIKKDFIIDQAVNIGAACLVAFLFATADVASDAILVALLLIFLLTKFASGWLRFQDALIMNAATKGFSNTNSTRNFKAFSDMMCDDAGVPPADVSITGKDYFGEYDPNTKTIHVGYPVIKYGTSLNYGVIAHETGHHIQFADERAAKRTELLVRLSRALKWTPWILLVFAIASMYFGNLSQIGIALTTAAVMYAASFACQSICEYDASTKAMRFLATSPEARSYAPDVGAIWKSLAMSFGTYLSELVGWSLFAAVITVAAVGNGLF